MKVIEKAGEFVKNRKWAVFMTVCGTAGMLLIMLSSLLPDKSSEVTVSKNSIRSMDNTGEYRSFTEKRLEDFIGNIDGAGIVKVYVTVGSGERYIYAREGRTSRNEGRNEEEEKYVMIGNGREQNALIETIEEPRITGAVILCSGGDSAAVRERVYKSVSAALDLPTARIYVTKLR